MSDSPSVLVVTSAVCESTTVAYVLAALEANGTTIRVYDAAAGEAGAIGWVLRTIGGESPHHKLQEEITATRPDVAIVFDAGTATILGEVRRNCAHSFPIVAVTSELSPNEGWSHCDADRFFVVDDEAAVCLEDHGVSGQSILPVGGIGELRYVEAAQSPQSALKKRFGISGQVALVRVDGLGQDASSQLALQLSLVKTPITYLFDAGDDRDAAASLRSQVPMLGMKAKLFGDTDDAPLYWRCADVIVASPSILAVNRAFALTTPLVCMSPKNAREISRAEGLETRGVGAIAGNPLMVGAVLERLLKASPKFALKTGLDGAQIIADSTWVIASQRREIVEEVVTAQRAGRAGQVEEATEYADWVATTATPAGDLEDLGGGGVRGSSRTSSVPPRPDLGKLMRLQEEIGLRKDRVTRTIADAQQQSAKWDRERSKAETLDNKRMAEKAERNADLERARMHSALGEMSDLAAEEKKLVAAILAAKSAPPPVQAPPPEVSSSAGEEDRSTRPRVRLSVEDELERLRRSSASAPPRKRRTPKKKSRARAGVDDELAALKRKMAKKRRQ